MEEAERNPWNVGSFDDFLYYCCPECDGQYECKDQFISHAFDQHPKSKTLVNSDQDPLVSESIDVKEELSHDLCDVTIAGILTETQINQLHESVTETISNVTKSVTTEEVKVIPKTDTEELIDEAIIAIKNVTKSETQPQDYQTFTCCFCNEVFDKHTLFKAHVQKKYSKNGVYKCHTCNISFTLKKHHDYVFHMTKRHNLGVFNFICKECGHAFSQNCEMVDHKRKFVEVPKYKCKKKCDIHPDLHFSSRCEIIQHNNQFHPELVKPLINLKVKEFKCEFCEADYFQRESLARHIKEIHPEIAKKKAEAKEPKVQKEKQVKYKCTEHQQEFFSYFHWK